MYNATPVVLAADCPVVIVALTVMLTAVVAKYAEVWHAIITQMVMLTANVADTLLGALHTVTTHTVTLSAWLANLLLLVWKKYRSNDR